METNASTAHLAFGMGPCGTNPGPAYGPQPGQGPRNTGHLGSSGATHHEDQNRVPQHLHQPHNLQHLHQPHHHIQHSRPFFYVQPSQLYPPPPLAYQWPVPMPYNPYCGYPGLGGYGMMIPNPLQHSPYVEHPGYVLARSQLHLSDYRRMTNPHFDASPHPQTMAYHARRFRYQHSATHAKEMINSEVQTDSLIGAMCSDSPLSKPAKSSSRNEVPTKSESGKSNSCAQPLNTVSAGQVVISKPAGGQVVSAPTTSSANARSTAYQKGSFLFQTEMEEVRIECCSTMSGLKLLSSQSQETGHLAATSTTTTQCVSHSVSGAGGCIKPQRPLSSLHPPEQRSFHHREAHGESLHEDGMRPCLVGQKRRGQACPDIIPLARSPSTEALSAVGECDRAIMKTQTKPPGNSKPDAAHQLAVETNRADGPQLVRSDRSGLSVNMQCLEELRKVSLWSVESLAPYVPSTELMIRQGLMALHRKALSPVVEVPVAEEGRVREDSEEVLTLEKEVLKSVQGPVVEEVSLVEVTMNEVAPLVEVTMNEVAPLVEVTMNEVAPLVEVTMNEVAPLVEVTMNEVAPLVEVTMNEVAPLVEVTMNEVAPLVEVTMNEVAPLVEEPPSAACDPSNMDAPASPESIKRGTASDLDHQDTSFEALPAYHPSASWLADLGNVCYYSKLPRDVPDQRQILRCSPLKLPGPKMNSSLHQEPRGSRSVTGTTTAHGIMGCRPGQKVDRRSYSDHECSANRTVNRNTLTPGGHKGNRICARCLMTKCRAKKIPGSPRLDAPIVKRLGVLVPPWEESVLAQTYAACKCLPRRQVMRKRSGSDVPRGHNGETSEGETSENSSLRARSGAPKLKGTKDPKRPLDSRSLSSLKSHSEKCSVALQSKLREKNCSCEVPHLCLLGPATATWDGQGRPRRHPRNNVIREQNEENVAVSLQDNCRNRNGLQDRRCLSAQILPPERLWRSATSTPEHIDSSRNMPRARSLYERTKHISQSQGMNRKDTRC
ncbi:hypothetical protein DPEC_G00079350 [Dallia pectoralis]|uniref:Uncharacterized protein n=1 Tax=Dallia pectoralis TaxID=75939 RepID=A0ACC2H4C6_DALPE|nr:hypothetical protein DPEC_G00079350 [Dallia pectoralis]